MIFLLKSLKLYLIGCVMILLEMYIDGLNIKCMYYIPGKIPAESLRYCNGLIKSFFLNKEQKYE